MASVEIKPELELDLDVSPAKALFVGDIVKSSFMPFPAINADESEMLALVLEAVDRFLQDKQDDFPEWDRVGEQPEEDCGSWACSV